MKRITPLAIVLVLLAGLGYVSSLFILIPMLQTGVYSEGMLIRATYWLLGSTAVLIIAARDIRKKNCDDAKI